MPFAVMDLQPVDTGKFRVIEFLVGRVVVKAVTEGAAMVHLKLILHVLH